MLAEIVDIDGGIVNVVDFCLQVLVVLLKGLDDLLGLLQLIGQIVNILLVLC